MTSEKAELIFKKIVAIQKQFDQLPEFEDCELKKALMDAFASLELAADIAFENINY